MSCRHESPAELLRSERVNILIQNSQGFVLPCDVEAGFGGCTKDTLIELADSYPRVPSLVLGLTPAGTTSTAPIFDINVAISTAVLTEFSTMFCPVAVQVQHPAKYAVSHCMHLPARVGLLLNSPASHSM